ncbi:MAG: hypothetical protein H6835_11390 [Planctomycetes bacterium]|nr:hypothetical protein [Planctomycetota bacterium]
MPDRPLQRDYARDELERRFVLRALPPAVEASAFSRLRDLFVAGSQLRLRTVEAPDGSVLIVKLGQKRAAPDAPTDVRRRRLTTIYMTEGEARVLSGLPGRRSCKRRYHHVEHGVTWAIDVWEAPASRAGLVMAEVECDSLQHLAAVPVPEWVEREVTTDPAFSAFELAE